MRYKFNNKFPVPFVYLCLYDLDRDEELFFVIFNGVFFWFFILLNLAIVFYLNWLRVLNK